MEDALVHNTQKSGTQSKSSLNPCFNGRCTRTCVFSPTTEKTGTVLILVLMEDALVLFLKAWS